MPANREKDGPVLLVHVNKTTGTNREKGLGELAPIPINHVGRTPVEMGKQLEHKSTIRGSIVGSREKKHGAPNVRKGIKKWLLKERGSVGVSKGTGPKPVTKGGKKRGNFARTHRKREGVRHPYSGGNKGALLSGLVNLKPWNLDRTKIDCEF